MFVFNSFNFLFLKMYFKFYFSFLISFFVLINSTFLGIEKTIPYDEKSENLLFYFEDRGINNHILGVRRAISLGIELNRTVVILPFGDGHVKHTNVFTIHRNLSDNMCGKVKVYIGYPNRTQHFTRYWKIVQDSINFFSNRAYIRYLEDLPQFHNITLTDCMHSHMDRFICLKDYIYSNKSIICIVDAYFIPINPHGSHGVQLLFSGEVVQTGIQEMKKYNLLRPYLGMHWRRGDFANKSLSAFQVIEKIRQYSNFTKAVIITNERNEIILNEIRANISNVIIRNSHDVFDIVVDIMIIICAQYTIYSPGSSFAITAYNFNIRKNSLYICSKYYGGL